MNILRLVIIVSALVLSCNVYAVAVSPGNDLHVDIAAVPTPGLSDYFSSNTEILFSFNMHVFEGTPSDIDGAMMIGQVPVSAFDGAMTWNDGGSHIWNLDYSGLSGLSINNTGEFQISLAGSGSTVNGYDISVANITFNLGVNPFTTTEQLSDLLLTSSITDLRLVVITGTNVGVWAPLNIVTSSITSVPLPAAMWFFGSGLIGLIGIGMRKSYVYGVKADGSIFCN